MWDDPWYKQACYALVMIAFAFWPITLLALLGVGALLVYWFTRP